MLNTNILIKMKELLSILKEWGAACYYYFVPKRGCENDVIAIQSPKGYQDGANG